MSRESFIFYQSFHRALEPLPPESYKNVMTAILEYAISGKEPELAGIEQSFFILIKPQLDKNQERYENGNKGGRPKTKPEPNYNQDITKPEPNENENTPQNGEDCFSFSESQGKKPEPPPDKPAENKENAITVFQRARNLWNERGLKPECRGLIIPPAKYDCLTTFQNYSWLDIENAIENYHYHVSGKCGEGWARPPPYGSIYGFLEKGVPRYFDDEAVKQQFKER